MVSGEFYRGVNFQKHFAVKAISGGKTRLNLIPRISSVPQISEDNFRESWYPHLLWKKSGETADDW